jgi:hypothetical protein
MFYLYYLVDNKIKMGKIRIKNSIENVGTLKMKTRQ